MNQTSHILQFDESGRLIVPEHIRADIGKRPIKLRKVKEEQIDPFNLNHEIQDDEYFECLCFRTQLLDEAI